MYMMVSFIKSLRPMVLSFGMSLHSKNHLYENTGAGIVAAARQGIVSYFSSQWLSADSDRGGCRPGPGSEAGGACQQPMRYFKTG